MFDEIASGRPKPAGTKRWGSARRQVDLVCAAASDVPVIGALCFVEADWPLIGGAFTSRGVHVGLRGHRR